MPRKKYSTRKYTAYPLFIEKMEASWTYAKLTDQEKKTLDRILRTAPAKGTYQERWDILTSVYNAYLYGLGYIDGA